MSPKGEIRAEHLWKRFRSDRRRMLLRDEIDRFREIRRGQGDSRFRWVLKDINLHAEPGEAVGLVGANGSGKSTLLKMLTRVMYPHSGRVSVEGRVGALIEVRAGISPDLTGRENIFTYGSFLGLSRKEVAKRFDEIVDFAELPDAIDRQVKYYSSGMQMRLGFGVAAFLEPDVLLVDEVLAVGDASFQQKCLTRMRHVLANGTTLVFVSHDLAAVEATCSRALWLNDGIVQTDGPVREVLSAYRSNVQEHAELEIPRDGIIRLVKAQVGGVRNSVAQTGRKLNISAIIDSPDARPANIVFGISEGTAAPIFVVRRDQNITAGETEVRCQIDRLPLPSGTYYLWVGVFEKKRDILPWHPVARFEVAGPPLQPLPKAIVRLAPLHVDTQWAMASK